MKPVMRLCLAAAALIAAGALAAGIALGLRSPQAGRGSQAAVRPAGPMRAARSPASAAVPASAAAPAPATAGYSLRTQDDAGDGAFNQLLGINNNGHIVGYFGSGAAGHPSRGYILRPPYGPSRYQDIEVPGSAQTRLSGLNDEGVQVGSWSAGGTGRAGESTGFVLMGGRFTSVGSPAQGGASPAANELLGVNDHDVAVGFYTDAQGRDHGYRYDIGTRRFSPVLVPGASSVTAAAINNSGGVAGFCAGPGHVTEGFYQPQSGQQYLLRVPGATMTEALGVNDNGEVVGDYQTGHGNGAITRGFTWTREHGFATVTGPDGAVSTTISGVNNAGDLVGFYVSRAGGTDGLVATPGG
jgi:hypothetical protein